MDTKNFQQQNKGIAAALLAMAGAIQPTKHPDGVKLNGRNRKVRKATKSGTTHKQGVSFKPRHIMHLVGSAYRSNHLGKTKNGFVPNYKLPHQKPRGRNLVHGA